MKIEERRIEAFLREPGEVSVVLLTGDDVGLIADRARTLVTVVAGHSDDAFRVLELDRSRHASLAEELAALPLTGGRRVVRLREATDAAADSVAAALGESGPGLAVVEAPGLPSRSRLRALVERAPRAALVPCYQADAVGIGNLVRDLLAAQRVTADADALMWLQARLAGDAAAGKREIEKALLYLGTEERSLRLEDVQAAVGDLGGGSLDDALFAAFAGEVAATDRALDAAFAEGVAAVAVVRAALAHVRRLSGLVLACRSGVDLSSALRTLRPPVFFKREDAVRRAATVWTDATLRLVEFRLWDAEAVCKRSGVPDQLVARQVVLGLARQAGRRFNGVRR